MSRPASRNASRTAALVLAAGLAAAALSGCGDDDGDEPGPAPSASESDAASSDPAPSESDTEGTDTEGGEPDTETPLGTGAAPADGETLELSGLSLRLPAGWRVATDLGEAGVLTQPEDTLDTSFLTVSTILNTGEVGDLDAVEQKYRDFTSKGDDARPVGDVEVGGLPMRHLSGVFGANAIDVFLADVPRYSVYLEFEIDDEKPQAERDELMDSVLATVEFTDGGGS